MALSLVCPKCRKAYSLPDNFRGKPIRCKKCGQAMGGNGAAKSSSGRPVAVGKPLPPPTRPSRPVSAKPSSAKKSKVGLVAVLAFVGLLVIGGGFSVWLATAGHKTSDTQVADAGSTAKAEQAAKQPEAPPPEKSSPPPPPPPVTKLDQAKVEPKPKEAEKPKEPEKPRVVDKPKEPEKPAEPAKPQDDALGKLLKEMDEAGKRQDGGAVVQRLNALAQMPRDDRRAPEVSQAINPWLNPDWQDGYISAERALKVWITPENIPGLGKLLERQDKNQAGPTLELLAQTKEPAAAELIATRLTRPDEQQAVAKILEAMGPAGVRGWVYGGSSENEFARTTSRKMLKDLKVTDAAIIEQVGKDVKAAETPAERRQWGAEWIGEIPVDADLKKAAVAALESLFLDSNPKVREAAGKSVARWATAKEDVPTLIVALDNPSPEARSAILMVLAKFNDERTGSAVAACLPTERALAVPILKAIGKSAEKAVAVWINHPDGAVREDVAKLLAEYKTSETILVAVAAKDLQSADGTTRSLAAQRLAKAKPTEALRPDVIEGAKTFLKNPDGNVRNLGVLVLGAWGTKEEVPYFLEKMDDDATRPGAMEALGALKDPRGAEAVAKRLAVANDRPVAVKSLLAMGPAAEDALVAVLKDKEKEEAVTMEVCKILKDTGTKKCLTALKSLATDKNKQVVQLAGEAYKAVVTRGK